jgi:hypothetical protein
VSVRPDVEANVKRRLCPAAEDGNVVATGDGKVEIADFDQDLSPSEVEVSCARAVASCVGRPALSSGLTQIVVKASSSKRWDERLGRQMKMHGEPEVRKVLKRFVDELREK